MTKTDTQNLANAHAMLKAFIQNVDPEDRTSELMEAYSSLNALVRSQQTKLQKSSQRKMQSIQSTKAKLDDGFVSFMKKLAS